jgi:hypothetical protein
LEEYLYSRSAVTVVEWAERWLGESRDGMGLGSRRLRRVWMEIQDGDRREIRYEDSGA